MGFLRFSPNHLTRHYQLVDRFNVEGSKHCRSWNYLGSLPIRSSDLDVPWIIPHLAATNPLGPSQVPYAGFLRRSALFRATANALPRRFAIIRNSHTVISFSNF